MWFTFNVQKLKPEFQMSEKKDSLMKVNLLMANNLMFHHVELFKPIEADFNNETGNIAFQGNLSRTRKDCEAWRNRKCEMTVAMIHTLIIPQKATLKFYLKEICFCVIK